MTVDPLAALRVVLLADTGVAALTTRIFGSTVPSTEDTSMPRACIVLKPAGGPGSPGGGYQDFGASRVDVFCYAENEHAAYLLYLAVYQALKQMTRRRVTVPQGSNALLHSADPLSKGTTGTDPVKQWPLCLSSWLVVAAEIAA